MSRLVKIYGHEGNRSVRWGYLCHQINPADAYRHVPSQESSAPEFPDFPIFFGGGSRAEGGQSADICPTGVPKENGKTGETGESGEAAGQAGVLDEEAEEERRIDELEALPLVCQTCSTSELVSRFGHPYWVVRCVNHNPFTYGGGDEKE